MSSRAERLLIGAQRTRIDEPPRRHLAPDGVDLIGGEQPSRRRKQIAVGSCLSDRDQHGEKMLDASVAVAQQSQRLDEVVVRLAADPARLLLSGAR
jgi:hypothetical protein